jgi:hypothetical protein
MLLLVCRIGTWLSNGRTVLIVIAGPSIRGFQTEFSHKAYAEPV